MAPETDIRQAWQALCDALQPAGSVRFNAPCDPDALALADQTLARPLPAPLAALYRLADGQPDGTPGVFTGNCRWSAEAQAMQWVPGLVQSTPCRFLPLPEALALYATLRDDEELDVFAAERIPFAADGDWTVLCVHAETGAVWLIWTGGPDWTTPREWQTLAHEVASDLGAFLHLVNTL